MVTETRQRSFFGYLLLLTLFFLFTEISLGIQGGSNLGAVANYIVLPAQSISVILIFICIQLVLHLLFVVGVWLMARLIGIALKCRWNVVEKLSYVLWGLCLSTVLLANQLYFPVSKMAILTHFIVPTVAVKFLLSIFLFFVVIALCISIAGLLFLLFEKRRRKFGWLTVFIVFGLSICLGLKFSSPSQPLTVTDGSSAERPNIIIIGVDSLRPDFLGFFGHTKITPHLDAFLNQATVFANAMTPIARTFPAWTSILTGRYPKHSGVRFNLANLENFDWQSPISRILQQKGYHTIFSTDETRFSNIDERFGFDKIVTPPIGVNDFLLGSINDFPLANLLINTSLGKHLFPYSYANRPAHITYNQKTYLKLLEPVLAEPRNKPLFLVVHFCLTHYPYIVDLEHNDPVHNYEAALRTVDQQFEGFLSLLKKYKVLDHSVVVLLSDHGEALAIDGDRATEADLFLTRNKEREIPHFYPSGYVTADEINQSVGHGTDILSLTQYHTVLAFRSQGTKISRTAVIPGWITLLDIKPTILSFLSLPVAANNDGDSLVPYILGPLNEVIRKRDIFVETDFSPQSIRSVNPNFTQVLLTGINFYNINRSNARITVKPEMASVIISGKQYAVIRGEWMLALYPQAGQKMSPILVNLNSGWWTNDLALPFAQLSPATSMLESLHNFYSNDIYPLQSAQAELKPVC